MGVQKFPACVFVEVDRTGHVRSASASATEAEEEAMESAEDYPPLAPYVVHEYRHASEITSLRSEVARLRAVVEAADGLSSAERCYVDDADELREAREEYRIARAALADPSSFAAMSTEEKMRVIDAKLAARGETHAEFLDRLGAALDAKEGA